MVARALLGSRGRPSERFYSPVLRFRAFRTLAEREAKGLSASRDPGCEEFGVSLTSDSDGNYATAQISTAIQNGRDLRKLKHGGNERYLVLNADDTMATSAMDFARSLPLDADRLAPNHPGLTMY